MDKDLLYEEIIELTKDFQDTKFEDLTTWDNTLKQINSKFEEYKKLEKDEKLLKTRKELFDKWYNKQINYYSYANAKGRAMFLDKECNTLAGIIGLAVIILIFTIIWNSAISIWSFCIAIIIFYCIYKYIRVNTELKILNVRLLELKNSFEEYGVELKNEEIDNSSVINNTMAEMDNSSVEENKIEYIDRLLYNEEKKNNINYTKNNSIVINIALVIIIPVFIWVILVIQKNIDDPLTFLIFGLIGIVLFIVIFVLIFLKLFSKAKLYRLKNDNNKKE